MLANIVSHSCSSFLAREKEGFADQILDGGQGEHVDIQTRVAGARHESVGEARGQVMMQD